MKYVNLAWDAPGGQCRLQGELVEISRVGLMLHVTVKAKGIESTRVFALSEKPQQEKLPWPMDGEAYRLALSEGGTGFLVISGDEVVQSDTVASPGIYLIGGKPIRFVGGDPFYYTKETFQWQRVPATQAHSVR